jgi:hypothetical protein
MLFLLAMTPMLVSALPGEAEEQQPEPVDFLITTDVGSLPRLGLELEAPMNPYGSAFIFLGYPVPVGLPADGRAPGPQVAAGWRAFMFGHGPWGFFIDGRLQVQVYFPFARTDPSPVIVPGGGLTLGINVRLWRVVVSPGISLFYAPDPAASTAVLPALRLCLGVWR